MPDAAPKQKGTQTLPCFFRIHARSRETSRLYWSLGLKEGFIEAEVESLEKQGFRPYHTGKRILRVGATATFLIFRLFIVVANIFRAFDFVRNTADIFIKMSGFAIWLPDKTLP